MITFSGRCPASYPEVEVQVASGAVPGLEGWNFEPFTVGKDADYPASALLYFNPATFSTPVRVAAGRPGRG